MRRAVLAVIVMGWVTAAARGQAAPATRPWQPDVRAGKEAKALLEMAVAKWQGMPAKGGARKTAAAELARALPLVGEDQRAVEIGRNARELQGEDWAWRSVAVTHARAGDAARAMAAVGKLSSAWNWSGRAETLAVVARLLIQAGRGTEGGQALVEASTASAGMVRRKDRTLWATTKELAAALYAAGDTGGAAKLFARAEAEARAGVQKGDDVQLGFRLTEIAAAAVDGGALDLADQFCAAAGDMSVNQRVRLAVTRVRRGDVATAVREAGRVPQAWMRAQVLRAIARARLLGGDEAGGRETAVALVAAAKGTPVSGQQATWQAVAEAYGLAGDLDGGAAAVAKLLAGDRDQATASLAIGLGRRGELAKAKATALGIADAAARGRACAVVARDALRPGAAGAGDVEDLMKAARSALEGLNPVLDLRPVATPLADAYVSAGDVTAAVQVIDVANKQAEDVVRALIELAQLRLEEPRWD
jgi:hypothetical protein